MSDENEMRRTASPWMVSHAPTGECIRDTKSGSGDIAHLLFNFASDRPREETEANAAFIVTACNSHDALVKALIEMRDYMPRCAVRRKFIAGWGQPDDCDCGECRLAHEVAAVLNQA